MVVGHFHHISHELQRLGDAGQYAVVAAVRAVFGAKLTVLVQHRHHSHREVQLFRTGLAATHIELQGHGLHFLVLCLELLL